MSDNQTYTTAGRCRQDKVHREWLNSLADEIDRSPDVSELSGSGVLPITYDDSSLIVAEGQGFPERSPVKEKEEVFIRQFILVILAVPLKVS